MVWAVPVSLAATKRIARNFFLNVMALSHQRSGLLLNMMLKHPFRKKFPYIAFYSYRYWDVSLPCVRSLIQGFLPMTGGFPHSDISGSKVIWHLTESYRSHITSFIAPWSQGIHHTPFVPVRNAVHHNGDFVLHKKRCAPLHNFLSVVWRYILQTFCFDVYRGRKDPNDLFNS